LRVGLIQALGAQEITMPRKPLHLLLAGLTLSMAACANLPSQENLVGTWKCGPTEMEGPGFTVTVSETSTNNPDGTFTTDTTTIISAPDKAPLTLLNRANGTWELADDILRTHFDRVDFISASDPSVSHEAGQKAQDDQLRKKSIYESRILGIERNRYRSIPVNSMYKEAVVESSCERT
jgi:hypothetical protein